MNADSRSSRDLVALHRVFLRLIKSEPLGLGRSDLVNEVVSHDAFNGKLNWACGVVMKYHAHDTHRLADVRQETILRLIERFTRGNFAYEDQGPERFGGWLYRVCLNACADAWTMYRASGLEPISLADDWSLSQCASRGDDEHCLDKLWRAIDSLTDLCLREIMLEFATGLSLTESAIRHELSGSTICRRRHDGVALLRQFYLNDMVDNA